MPRSRRDLLRLAALGASGLAGCVSFGGSNVSYPSTNATGTSPTTGATTTTGRAGSSTGTTSTEPTTTERTTTTAAREVNPALAADTDRVFSQLAWFGTEYRDAVAAYRSAVERVRSTVGQIRRSAEVTANDVRRIEATTGELSRLVEARLAPHFPVDDRLLNPENVFVRTVRKFASRGDWDRAKEELDAMYRFYLDVGTDRYVEEAFSTTPVRGRLLDVLRVDGAAPRALFEVTYLPTGFAAFCYPGEDRHPLDDPVDAADRRRYDALFESVAVSRGRRDHGYVVAHPLPEGFAFQSTDRLRSRPAYLQRFADAGTATDALARMLAGPVVQEGTRRLGTHDWRQVYYYHGGDIVYAFAVQAGPYVLAMAPSTTAWEERSGSWSEPLERSWLWNGA